MLFLNSDFKSSYYTTRSACLWIAITCAGFPIKLIHAQAPVKWQIPAVYPRFKCFVCMCARSHRIMPWLEPRVFPDITILRCVFAVYTHASRGTKPCPFCADLGPAAESLAEAAAAAGEWSWRLHSIDLAAVRATEKKADISWERLSGHGECR